MNADELLRIHVMGGTGTLSEAVNSTVNMPNVQLAAYPYGNENVFLQYFGADKAHFFSSIRSQVFSDTTPVDIIKCGHKYGISHGLVGFEAAAGKMGLELFEKNAVINQSFAYILAAAKTAYGPWMHGQKYMVELDGQRLDGAYISILIANAPCYSKNMYPASDAHPNDGLLDIYLTKKTSRFKYFSSARRYLSGNYKKIPDIVSHYRGKRITLSSENVMILTIDDKPFYENTIEYEILPYAIDFVCPGGIDVDKLPRVYGRTGAGEYAGQGG